MPYEAVFSWGSRHNCPVEVGDYVSSVVCYVRALYSAA